MSLPQSAGATLVPLASLLGERVAESREGLDSNVGDLVRLCVHASSLRGIGAIAELSTRTTARILGLSSAQLDLWREDDVRPRLVSFWRRHDVHLEPLDAEMLMRLERTTDAHVTSSVVAAQEVGLADGSTESLIVLPLRAGGGPVGLLTGRLAGPAPTKDHLEAATLFAQHTAALIDVATALRREKRAAVTDQLTGLLNRRGFDERFHEELRRAASDDMPVSVIVCDCDGLKTMNDLRGHERGDALLELIASCLRTHKRVSDVAARTGGDEFADPAPELGPGYGPRGRKQNSWCDHRRDAGRLPAERVVRRCGVPAAREHGRRGDEGGRRGSLSCETAWRRRHLRLRRLNGDRGAAVDRRA